MTMPKKTADKEDPTDATAGAWDGLLNAEAFEADLEASREAVPT
jgi:hypothetical protein